jgi:hypothetical protein
MANWLKDASKNMEKKGTKGALHRYFAIPEDKTIPVSLLRKTLKDPKITETTRKRIMFALNAGKIARAGLTPALASVAEVCASIERAD